ncbi:MAG: DDE-type integrase/transposase/recombinase [Candidatus Competibacteraceae bacterium]|nr:DDE-type integrase/transposase/recombinase [Candidatus Competibacteraceae bacterium]
MQQFHMRKLLKKSTAFQWLPEMQIEFEKCKEILTSNLVVSHFDSSLKTSLLTDASRLKGLGYALLQERADGVKVLIECGSRSLNPAESRYSTIELEALGIAWAAQKCHYFLMGCPHFTVVTDHRPLLGIFSKQMDALPNERLRRIRERLTPFSFDVTWCAGAKHSLADCLSRSPVFDPPEEGSKDAICLRIRADFQPYTLAQLVADQDGEYKSVLEVFKKQNLNLNKLPTDHPARQLKSIWSEMGILETEKGSLLVLDGHRIIVPKQARPRILSELHKSHQGLVKTRAQAKLYYFWPGLNKDIEKIIQSCQACQAYQPSQQIEPLISTEAEYAMQQVGLDLFELDSIHYFLMVDRFSGYPFVQRLQKTDTEAIAAILKGWFSQFGIPEYARSDGGPQFRSKFTDFCNELGIKHELCSAYNSQSNGLAEAAVKNVKRLLQKCKMTGENFDLCLAAFRTAPRSDSFSPADMFFGRKIRGHLPIHPSLTGMQVDLVTAKNARQGKRAKQNEYQVGKVLDQLELGQEVFMQDPHSKRWNLTGFIKQLRDDGRSYLVEDPFSRKEFLRNRRHLRPVHGMKTRYGKDIKTPKVICSIPTGLKSILGKHTPGASPKKVTFGDIKIKYVSKHI